MLEGNHRKNGGSSEKKEELAVFTHFLGKKYKDTKVVSFFSERKMLPGSSA